MLGSYGDLMMTIAYRITLYFIYGLWDFDGLVYTLDLLPQYRLMTRDILV